MKKWLKRIGVGVGVLVLFLGVIVFDFLRHGGQFVTIAPHFAGECDTLPMQASAEDIQIDRERGIAYLSYFDRRAKVEGNPTPGTVMLLDLNTDDPHPRGALLAEPPEFQPHGMSLYTPADGRRALFVISHPKDKPHEVLIFEESVTGAFALVETVRDPLLLDPNAILAVGPRQFYVANDSGAENRFDRATEMLFRRGLSKVVYWNGEAMSVAADGMKTAAGIAGSLDHTRVYVAETSGKRIAVFSRDVINGDLKELEKIDIGSAPDNLNVDADGDVWIAAHAKVSALVKHFGNAASLAPTQIFRFKPNAEGDKRLEEIYLNAGDAISAGSVGAHWQDKLLIGSITERKVLLCTLPKS